MSFDGERIGAERGPVPNIRDRIKALAANAGAGNINAVFGHEVFIMRQIDRWHGIFRPISASPSSGGENAERTPQQVACPAHSACRKQSSDVAARYGFPAQSHLGIAVHLKSHLAAKLAQRFNISRCFVSEVE